MITRRNFIKASAASALAGVSALDISQNNAFAKINPNDFKTLVCIFLNGGNDSFNMLMPNTTAEYNAYAQSRQFLAHERSSLLPISPNGLGSNSFGLHPGMTELKNMFDDGDASLITNIGGLVQPTNKADIINGSAILPAGLGGHNSGQSYALGDHDNSIQNSTQDGIGGRLANEFENTSILPTNISIGTGYSLFSNHAEQRFYSIRARGLVRMHDYNLADGRFNNLDFTARREALSAINSIGSSDPNLLLRHSSDLITSGIDLSLTVQGFIEEIPPINTSFADNNTSQSLARAAELISIRETLGMHRQIIFIQVPQFDKHDFLRPGHDQAMESLSKSLSEFNDAMKEIDRHSSVLTYTASDFGRTLTSTGSGTDHAWGGNDILMSGAIKGGELFGTYPSMELDSDDDYRGDGRMIPTTSITQHGATIARWFGVPQNRLSAVFPNMSNFAGQTDLGYFA